MAIEKITMPQLGESVTEGTISKWLVKVGSQVNKYDPLAEIITDKVTAEIPSSYTGVIKEILAGNGDTLQVGEVICLIETEAKLEQEAQSAEISAEKVSRPQPVHNKKPQKARYSPAVLKLSQEHGIDLNEVSGTGLGGRITRKDVLTIIESGAIPRTNVSTEALSAKQELVTKQDAVTSKRVMKPENVITTNQGDIEIPVSGVRRAIANQMIKSKNEVPHAWMMVEVDVTDLVQYRNEIKEDFKQKEGFNITYFAFFVKAVAQSLKEYPEMNSMWAEDKIVQKKDINLSIAVSTENELFTPVIRNADEKSIKGIAREINDYALKVRSGKLKVDDLKGGTFTVNNTGTIGSVQSMGIINQPQAAILQVESIIKRPVVMNNNMIAIRDMVNLCLSLDHRVLDGFICGKFMHKVKQILENTSKENTPIY
ncbi:dihydrolipoamide acetyltransferase family protein [Niallia sp. XMNu-256]|uniref:dihydrolipoamide acetyltransferase family protein n=1 Tax=Niallia sp. XMNu-256 TaxID=3082444 RepID=UPI0030CE0625